MMINKEKCIDILNELGADAMLLCNEANMHYVCGFSPSEGMILIFNDGEAYHLVDSRYTERANQYATQNRLNVVEISLRFVMHVAELMGEHGASSIVYENETITLKQFEALKELLYEEEFIPLGNKLMQKRNCKEAEEIVLMKKANDIAEKSFIELLNHIEVGKSEKDLAAYFDYLMAKNGSDGVSFDTILLSGARTSMPHGVPSNKKIEDGEFVLFDFGATYQCYHSDMTRTIAIGSATDEMKEMYDLVLQAQKAGIKALNAGVKCADVYKASYDVLDEKNMAQYFRHGLGHGVGLEIHEGYSASPNSKDTYEVGNVTSIEPGIYIPDRFGIRIEDVCYISPRGRENLSKITKELIIL